MYQYNLSNNKKEFANKIVEEANYLLAHSPFLFRSLNDNDNIEEGLRPLSDEPYEHDAYDHLRDGSLKTNLISFSISASCPFVYYYPYSSNKTRISVCDTSKIDNEIIEAKELPQFKTGNKRIQKNWAIASQEYMVRGNVPPESLDLLYEENFDNLSSFKEIPDKNTEAQNYTQYMGKFVSYFQSRFNLSSDAPATFNFIMGRSKETYNSADQSTVLKAIFTVIANDYAVCEDKKSKADYKELYATLAKHAECRVRYNQIKDIPLPDDSIYAFSSLFSKLNVFVNEQKNNKKIGDAILNDFIPNNLPHGYKLLRSEKMNDLYVIKNDKGEYSVPFTIDNRKRLSETYSDEIKELANCYAKIYQNRFKQIEKIARTEYKNVSSSSIWKKTNGAEKCNFFNELYSGFCKYCDDFGVKDKDKAIDALNDYFSLRGEDLNGGRICECNYNGYNQILKQFAYPDKISLPFLCTELTKVKDLKKDFKAISELYKKNFDNKMIETQKNNSFQARNHSSRMKM